jgi:hypothetical protein
VINEVYEPYELQCLIESSRRILRHVPAVGGDFQKLGFASEVGFLLSQFEGLVSIPVNKPYHCLHYDDTCSPEILFLLVLEGIALCFILCWLFRDSYITAEMINGSFLLPYFCGENPLTNLPFLNFLNS